MIRSPHASPIAKPELPIAAPYSELANAYDATLGIPSFIRTAAAFEALVRRYGIGFASAADIGCGTGLFACYLRRVWGVPVLAVDRSPAMLRVAVQNGHGLSIVFLRQDMRHLCLPHQVDLITANFDTLNHLLTGSAVRAVFRRVYQNLRPGGHFIFDLITPCQPPFDFAYVRSFRSRAGEVRQRICWNPRQRLLDIVVVHHRRGASEPVIELHRERAFPLVSVGRWLGAAGFVLRAVLDAATLENAAVCPVRAVIVAWKPGRGAVSWPGQPCAQRV